MHHTKKHIIKRLLSGLSAAAVMLGTAYAYQPPIVYSAPPEDSVLISPQASDTKILPDLYNTGAKGELRRMYMNDTVSGLQLKAGGKNSSSVLSFYYRNKDVTGTVVIENCDFTGYTFNMSDEELIGRDITVVFRNCKFSDVSKSNYDSHVFFEFENCTMVRFKGSNAKLTRCALGGTIDDAIKPVRHVYFDSCYVYDMIHYDKSGSHIDGVQIAGEPGIEVTDLFFDSCRFEMPYIYVEPCATYPNACIMLQIEKSNCTNVTFKDCTVNGGGDHSVYATQKVNPDGTLYPYDIHDVTFENLTIGDDYLQKPFYGIVSPNVEFKGISKADSLYVGTVWREGGSTYLSVTNDTHKERKLKVVTDKGVYDFNIPALPTRDEMQAKKIDSFYDLPIDVKYTIPADCDYAVCLDTTNDNYIKQIRFENFAGYDVAIDSSHFGTAEQQSNNIIAQGSLGKNITYTLDKSGVLTVSGEGYMYNYHSGSISPIAEISGLVKKIVIEEGVKSIGNQTFKFCIGLDEVVVPDGLEWIGNRCFTNCVSLKSIKLPASAKTISADALIDSPNCVFIFPRKAGDVNADGEVDIKDVTLLKQYLAKWNVKLNESNADVTGDGDVNVKDLTLLKQYLAKWKVELV